MANVQNPLAEENTSQFRKTIHNLEKRSQQLEMVVKISQQLTSILELGDLLRQVVVLTRETFNYYHVHIYLVDETRTILLMSEGYGEAGAEMKRHKHQILIAAPRSLVARAAREKRIIIVEDVRRDPTWLPNVLLPNTHSEMAVPIIIGEQVMGVLDVQENEIGGLDKSDADLLRTLANHIAVAIQNAQLYGIAQQELTERKRAETALKKANQELTKLNADKDKFFSIVAHDLKGPFQPLLGLAHLLLETADQVTPQDALEIGGSIYRSAKNIYDLLENLLEWSRIQRGHLEYNPIPLDLRLVVERAVNLLAENALYKQITLKSTITAPLYIQADENMLYTVIRNLISNALKFTPAGGSVTINQYNGNSVTAEKLTALVEVADTGVGISEKNLAKLFKIEDTLTTTGTAKEKGTGLGLIICKEMVEQHGGEISVISELHKGTAVRFTVPLAEQHMTI